MTINVVVLERGGCSASGGAWFDPRERIVRLDVFEDELLNVTIQFPFAVSETDYEEDGIDGSTPVISSNVVTLQFSQVQPSGTYQILGTASDGQTKRVRFQANAAQPVPSDAITPTDDDDVDYGAWG